MSRFEVGFAIQARVKVQVEAESESAAWRVAYAMVGQTVPVADIEEAFFGDPQDVEAAGEVG